jgi:hypothetical protein
MACHVTLASFLKADPEAQRAYTSDAGWTKVILAAPDEATLWLAYRRACDAGIPAHLWVEDDTPIANFAPPFPNHPALSLSAMICVPLLY